MPPRIARSSVQIAAPKNARNKNRKRHLDAYAIASHSAPDKTRIRRHRLGEILDDGPKQKRRRAVEDEDGEEDSVEEEVPAKRPKRANANDEDIEEGSDSEGNEWTLGGLAEDDDDSDLDSDEAFGESDEEKFEGFTFRGSSGGNVKKASKKRRAPANTMDEEVDIDLDEADPGDDEEDEDDFGDEGVDLATMLDDEDEEVLGGKDTTGQDMGEESASDDEDAGDEDSTSESDSEQGDDGDAADEEERRARMRDRLEALDGDQQVTKTQSASAPTTLTVDDLLADLDPAARKQFSAALKTRKKSERPTTLAAPLPKRQQDKLNREVASAKAQEQLDRWRDTVIQNRRAEHLSFPLRDPDAAEPVGKDKFLQTKPQNELEANIQRIMEESGMASKPGEGADDDGEDALMKSEELGTNKLPVEEVLRRRAELRRTRELLFREEIKAKRIAKIKSRSYRRVHRKQKERIADKEREQREMMGIEPAEDEKERADRKRAEERMGTKHRDSKWAKTLKATNRTVWDEGARDGVIEAARRREELKKRIAGEEVDSDEDGSDVPSDGEGSGISDDDEDAQTLSKLDRISRGGNDGRESKGLAGMKFMRAADEQRRAQNDEDVERLRKELAIEDGDEESGDEEENEEEGIGRAIFGPQGKQSTEPVKKAKRPELEEGDVSGDEEAGEADAEPVIVTEKAQNAQSKNPESASKKTKGANGLLSSAWSALKENEKVDKTQGSVSDWLSAPIKKSKRNQRTHEADGADFIDKTTTALPEPTRNPGLGSSTQSTAEKSRVHQDSTKSNVANTDGWRAVLHKDTHDADSDNASDAEPTNPILTPAEQKASLTQRAFAGDNVRLAFAAEKEALAASEDEKEESSHLPGWGSWTGAGLSKSVRRANARQKHNPLFKTKVPGVRPEQRRDKGLENVIVSEKGDRKGKKYLAPVLPHGFERREEYERSLRVPVGPEWTTKETFQRATKPRVVVKPGVAIGAMERPLV